MDPLPLLVLAFLLSFGALRAFRWLRKLQRLEYQELEKALYGSESIHLPLHQRQANADRVRTKTAILVAGLILAASIVAFHALRALLFA